MRSLSYCFVAALLVAMLAATGAFSRTHKQRPSVPNQCLDGLDAVKKQIERTAKDARTKTDGQIPLNYAGQIAADTLTARRTGGPLHKLIACLHEFER